MRAIFDHVVPGKVAVNAVYALDDPGPGGACHKYGIDLVNGGGCSGPIIQFQNGPIQEVGVNGVQNEDLLAVVIDRLRGFQSGAFACRENAIALTNIEQALLWLLKRTLDRSARGVEGKNQK